MYETGKIIDTGNSEVEPDLFKFANGPVPIEPSAMYLFDINYKLIGTAIGAQGMLDLLKSKGHSGYYLNGVLKCIDTNSLLFRKYYVSTDINMSVPIKGEDSKTDEGQSTFDFEALASKIRSIRNTKTETNSYICSATNLHKSFVSRLLNADKVKMVNCEVRNLVKILVFFDLDFNDYVIV